MRYKVIINLLLAVFLTAALTAQHEVTDFRGLEWGEELSQASFDDQVDPMFQREGTAENRTVYSRINEDYNIGSVKLNQIHYHFNQNDQFVRLVLKGNERFNEDMESILLNQLGPPTDMIMRQYEAVRVWEQENVTVVFREMQSKDFQVDFRSKIDLRQKMKMNAQVDDF